MKLTCTDCKIGPNGAHMIASVLLHNSVLSVLHLEGDDIGVKGAKALGGIIQFSNSLTSLYLSCTKCYVKHKCYMLMMSPKQTMTLVQKEQILWLKD